LRSTRHIENTCKLNTTIVNDKTASIKDQDVYKLYLIAETYLHNKRGYFTLDELIIVLRDTLGYDSLKQKSNIFKFKEALHTTLFNSPIFFKHIENEQFKIISNRKVLHSLGTSKYKSTYYYIPQEYLHKKNKTLFRDAIIGCFLLLNKGYSNDQVAKHFNITRARVQYATRRNNKSGVIEKHLRYVMTPCNTRKDAIEVRKALWELEISTVMKKKENVWYICCYRTNSYNSKLQSHKSGVRPSAEKRESTFKRKYSKVTKDAIIFKSGSKKLKINLPDEGDLYFKFKDSKRSNWNLDSYIQEYATLYV
jgi:hypothetical protein